MNSVIVSGYLIRDPEVRYTPSGKAFARMGISVRRRSAKVTENGYPESDIFNLIAWEKTADFCGRYLKKGSKVFVEGRLQTSSYEGKDGIKRTSVDIVVSTIEFADSKRSDNGDFSGQQNFNQNNSQNKQNNSDEGFDDSFKGEEISEEDVPF